MTLFRSEVSAQFLLKQSVDRIGLQSQDFGCFAVFGAT